MFTFLLMLFLTYLANCSYRLANFSFSLATFSISFGNYCHCITNFSFCFAIFSLSSVNFSICLAILLEFVLHILATVLPFLPLAYILFLWTTLANFKK